jgi:sterol 24-C-methyltransferase
MPGTEVISHEEARRHAFDTVLHRASGKAEGGVRALVGKNGQAYSAASKEYFQYWNDKKAEDETESIRQERTDNYATISRQ